MKKIVASVGLIALASGMNAVQGQDITATPYKPWKVSASLRGFYDDNINTVPNGPDKISSWGFQVDPGLNLNWQNEQTRLSAGYVYTFRYYDKKPINNSVNYDQDHSFNAALAHAFSERYQIAVNDSFVIGQEPDFLRASSGQAFSDFQRVSGNNIRNYGDITFDAVMTRIFSLELGYNNQYFDYADSGGNATTPSTAGLLNRIDQSARLDTRWQVAPQTIGVIGYTFEQVSYIGNEPIGLQGDGTELFSQDRNSYQNKIYAGADHNFTPDFSGSLRAGGNVTDYYNNPGGSASETTPFVTASLKYVYTVESSVEGGFSYDRTPIDIVSPSSDSFVRDADAIVVYAHLTHRIVPDLTGSLIAQFQDTIFNGGSVDGETERYFMLGLDLEYRFNAYLAANLGYNYDKVNSDINGRSYDRNRVYFGLKASY